MSRDLEALFQAEILKTEARATFLMKLEVPGQTPLRFTQLDEAVSFDDDGGGPYTFTPRAFRVGGVKLSSQLTGNVGDLWVSNVDLTVGALFLTMDLSNAFCTVWFAMLDSAWAVVGDPEVHHEGFATSPVITEKDVTFKLEPYAQRLTGRFQRRTLSPVCPWTFGDATCAKSVASYSGTVAAGSTAQVINDAGIVAGVDYYRQGDLLITSGALSGQRRSVRVNGAGTVTLEVPLSAVPANGVGFTLRNGCNKSFEDCRDRHSNTGRYGGFAAVPGTGGS